MYTRIVQPGFRPVATTVVAALPGEPVFAERVFCPGVGPRVQPFTVTVPAESVVALAESIFPPPPVMANFTVAPRTGRPVWSFTRSTGATGSEAPRRPTCWLPATTLIEVPTREDDGGGGGMGLGAEGVSSLHPAMSVIVHNIRTPECLILIPPRSQID